MQIDRSLFEAEHICLAPIDHEKDPDIESRWTHDSLYMRMLDPRPALPMSPAQIKKKYESLEKQVEEDKNMFYFTLRIRSDDRLIGFARIYWIEWSNGIGLVQLGIGDATDRNQGYGFEALKLLLRYGFDELNLHRLGAFIPEYNTVALRLFAKASFVEEVRRRQAFYRDNRRWDAIHLGLLRREWSAQNTGASKAGDEQDQS